MPKIDTYEVRLARRRQTDLKGLYREGQVSADLVVITFPVNLTVGPNSGVQE